MRVRAEGRGQRAEKTTLQLRAVTVLFFLLTSALCPLPLLAQADRTNEVLRGISDNIGQEVDPNKLIAVVIAIVGLAVLIWVVSFAKQRGDNPKPLNSHGKLLKELARAMNLKPAEVRQLKTLAEQQKLCNPLVLLLCPSLLTQAVKENPGAVDRRLVAGLARKTIGKA